VRSKPAQAQISAASAAYALIRNGRAGGLQIKDGNAVKPSLLGKLNLMKNASIRTRMISALASSIGVGVCRRGMGLLGMGKTKDALGTTYENSVHSLQPTCRHTETAASPTACASLLRW